MSELTLKKLESFRLKIIEEYKSKKLHSIIYYSASPFFVALAFTYAYFFDRGNTSGFNAAMDLYYMWGAIFVIIFVRIIVFNFRLKKISIRLDALDYAATYRYLDYFDNQILIPYLEEKLSSFESIDITNKPIITENNFLRRYTELGYLRVNIMNGFSYKYNSDTIVAGEVEISEFVKRKNEIGKQKLIRNMVLMGTEVQFPFEGETYVFTKKSYPAHINSKMEKIRTESQEFNKYFIIKTSHPAEALKLMKTNVIENILYFYTVGSNLSFQFKDNTVTILYDDKDGFAEPPLNRKLKIEDLEKAEQELKELALIVHNLKINYKTTKSIPYLTPNFTVE